MSETATIHITAANAAFLADLVRQERREALDADAGEIIARCDAVLRSLDFALHMVAT